MTVPSGERTTAELAAQVEQALTHFYSYDPDAEGRLHKVHRADCPGCAVAAALAELRQRAEHADRLQHRIDCADTPLMRDVLTERDRLRDALEQIIALPTDAGTFDVVWNGEEWTPQFKDAQP